MQLAFFVSTKFNKLIFIIQQDSRLSLNALLSMFLKLISKSSSSFSYVDPINALCTAEFVCHIFGYTGYLGVDCEFIICFVACMVFYAPLRNIFQQDIPSHPTSQKAAWQPFKQLKMAQKLLTSHSYCSPSNQNLFNQTKISDT